MKIVRVLIALILGMACVPLSAEVVYNSTDPFLIYVDPAVCSEAPSLITGTGVGLTVIRQTTSGTGMVHMGITLNGRGKATDAYGDTWVLSDGDNYLSFNGFLNPDGSFETTQTESFHLI